MLMVDRAPQPSGSPVKAPSGFIGDHFVLGAAGEVWVIDTIRVWAAPGKSSAKVALFGGIEAPPAKPGEPECDCHNLMQIQAKAPGPGGPVDFKQVSWSVPGGSQIQFGVMGVALQSMTAGEHQLKKFDSKGKLLGELEGADKSTGIAVQVWAHLTASLAIQSLGGIVDVALRGSPTFDVTHADLASLRFGPKGASPLSTLLVNAEGNKNLTLSFRAADVGIQPTDFIACLKGRLQNGTPFEACDGLAAARTK